MMPLIRYCSVKYLFFLFCLLPIVLTAAEKKVRLQYVPNLPVNLVSKTELEITQSLPGLSLATRGSQTIDATLSIEAQQSDLSITQGPVDLAFTLNALQIQLKANDEELSFDSKDTEPSLYLNQVSKIIDRPLKIRLDEEFKLASGGPDLTRMARELPVLKEVSAECILIELFLHLFAFGGEELTQGQKLQRKFEECSLSTLPRLIEYTITEIDDYNVYAAFKGDIDKQKFQLLGEVKVDDEASEFVNVTLSGSMEGKARWNRDNAMLHEIEALYTYSAKFKLGKWKWLMNVSMKVNNRSRLKG